MHSLFSTTIFRTSITLVIGCLFFQASNTSWSDISITTDYPGGNLIVDSIKGDTVHIRQDQRDTKRWWFYWNFKVDGAADRTLKFKFKGKSPIGVYGPAVSLDDGASWSWLGVKAVNGSSFSYTFPAESKQVQFSFSIPYQQSNLDAFLAEHAQSKSLSQEILCTSNKGRSVELLRAGCIDREPKFRILLTARHHACESIANFVLEGILDGVLAEDEAGTWLRKHAEIIAIPFMDKDGVEDGDQGKGRVPHDHNRDYSDTSIHTEVASLRTKMEAWSKGKLRVTLDLHCPSIRGGSNEMIYLVGNADKTVERQQMIFSTHLETLNTSPLSYRASDNLLFGLGWNTEANYSQGKSFARWGGELDGVSLSGTMEIPYANIAGEKVTPENTRAFGQSLAKALYAYLNTLEP